MSANLITFDSQYTSDQVKNLRRAQQVLEEAIRTLKKASAHEGWKCPETKNINDSMSNITSKLTRLNTGITGTAEALSNGVERFTELETRAENQSNSISSSIQNQYGFNSVDQQNDELKKLALTLIPIMTNIFKPLIPGVIQTLIPGIPQWFVDTFGDVLKKKFPYLFGEGTITTDTTGTTGTATTQIPTPTPTPTPAPAPTPEPEPTPAPTPVQSNETSQQTIWNFLYDKIGNEYGVAALMGNLQAESGLSQNNLQNNYEKSLGMTDAEYTAAVDNGSYNNFVYDSAGYGLAQWTYYSRKQGLLDYAKAKGTSVGDLQTQLEYLWKELSEGYTGVLHVLKNATSIREASDVVLKQFERPYDQSEAVCERRASYANSLYSDLHTA